MGIVKDFEKVAICADFEKNHEVVEDMVHARGREKVTCEDGWTSTSELGGALEEVVVEELLKKNKDLQEQVARLMEERKKGSEPSWSEVVGLTTPARRPGGKPIYSPYFHVRAESYSEFGSSW